MDISACRLIFGKRCSLFWIHVLPYAGGAAFNSVDLGLLQSYNVFNEITLVNVEDGAETELMNSLEKTNVTVVGDQCSRVAEKRGMIHGSVEPDICLVP